MCFEHGHILKCDFYVEWGPKGIHCSNPIPQGVGEKGVTIRDMGTLNMS